MTLTILVVIPWVVAVVALLYIMFWSKAYDYEDEDDCMEDDFSEEDLLTDRQKRSIIKVAVYEDKAYWVYNNVLYESETTREPDWDTARPVDTMAMKQKDINKLLKVLDELQEFDEQEGE
jgi:nitrogen fixation-related uncharacterized protein